MRSMLTRDKNSRYSIQYRTCPFSTAKKILLRDWKKIVLRILILSHVSMLCMHIAILLYQCRNTNVCPFHCRYCVETNAHTVKLFDGLVGALFYFFEPQCHYEIPGATPSAGAFNTRRWENFANIAFYLGNGGRDAYF